MGRGPSSVAGRRLKYNRVAGHSRGSCLSRVSALARIFLALALFALSLLVANIVLGLRIGGFNARWIDYKDALAEFEEQGKQGPSHQAAHAKAKKHLDEQVAALSESRQRKTLHFLFGVAGSLVTVLVSSVSVTYFIGTSRWCREVVETYHLDDELAERSRRLKRRAFPWALLSIAAIVCIIALGASADPSVSFEEPQSYVVPHYIAALAGVAVIAYSLFAQLGLVAANYEIIDAVMTQVTAIRTKKGLD